MKYYLSTEKDGHEKCQQVAYVKKRGKIVKKIYLCETKDRKNQGKQQLLWPPDTFDSESNYEDGVFPFFTTTEEQNNRLMITGSSGSGKSQFIANCLRQMSNRLKEVEQDDYEDFDVGETVEDQIVIISAVDQDKAFDGVLFGKQEKQVIRLDIKSDQLDKLDAKQFVNSIVIFDDIENYSKKKIRDHFVALRAEMLENARHQVTDVISVSHKAKSGVLNSAVKNECTGVALFPSHTNNYRELNNFLKEYLGYSGEISDRILVGIPEEYNSRFVFIGKRNPNFIIHNHGVEIVPRLIAQRKKPDE